MSNMQLWAGASCIDITPPLGTRINGDFITHFAHSIHDNLFCKALALKSGEETVVIVVVDVCYMQDDFLRPIRKEISQRSGLREENLLFCCTHAHSSGAVCDLLLGAADLPYTRRLPDLIISSVIVALNNLIPAKIAFGSVDVPDHVLCRRYFMRKGYESYNPVTGQPDLIKTNPIGDEDQIVGPVAEMDAELSYIAIKSTNDQWISLLANYSLHYVGDFSAGIISADYFGEFSTQLKTILNAQTDFVGILTNGTSGDANVWDLLDSNNYPKGDFEKSRLIANDLAKKIASTLKDLEWDYEPAISGDFEELILKVRKPSLQEFQAAVQTVKASSYESITIVDNDFLKSLYAREQVLLYEGNDHDVLPIQVIKVGNIVIGTLAGEFFAETGLWLKQNSPVKNYFTIGLANGCVGYVPPAHEFELGGYETWRCRSSKLDIYSENYVRQKLLDLINKVCSY